MIVDLEARKHVDRYNEGIVTTSEFVEAMIKLHAHLRGEINLEEVVAGLHTKQLADLQRELDEAPQTEEDWAAYRYQITEEFNPPLTWIERVHFCVERQRQVYRLIMAMREILPPGYVARSMPVRSVHTPQGGRSSHRRVNRGVRLYAIGHLTDIEFFNWLIESYTDIGDSLDLSDALLKLPADRLEKFKSEIDEYPNTEEDWAATRIYPGVAYVSDPPDPPPTIQEIESSFRESQRQCYHFVKAVRRVFEQC